MKDIPKSSVILKKHKEFLSLIRSGEWISEEIKDWKSDVLVIPPNMSKISIEIGDIEETQRTLDFICNVHKNYQDLIDTCEQLITIANTYRNALLRLNDFDL